MAVQSGLTYTDQMFNYTSAVTALTQMNSGVSSAQGTYSPQLNGYLLKIEIICTPQAVTSLCQQYRVELSNPKWTPNTLRFPGAGFGLATAPQVYGGNQEAFDFLINQPVTTDSPITGYLNEFWSAVTPNVVVTGFFST